MDVLGSIHSGLKVSALFLRNHNAKLRGEVLQRDLCETLIEAHAAIPAAKVDHPIHSGVL